MSNFRLPDGYKVNFSPKYYLDEQESDELVWQPEIYEFVKQVMVRSNIKNIVDIGSGNGGKLETFLKMGCHTHVFDFGENLERLKKKYASYSNLFSYECNLEHAPPSISSEILRNAVVVASDVIEHVVNPNEFLKWLSNCCREARLVIISTPDRDRTRGWGSLDAPQNRAHVREWNLSEFLYLAKDYGFGSGLHGFTIVNNLYPDRSTMFFLGGRDVLDESKIECEVDACLVLRMDYEYLHGFSDVLKRWKNESMDIYFRIERSGKSGEVLDFLRGHGLGDRVVETEWPFHYTWCIEVPFLDYLIAPNGIPLKKAISCIEELGYTKVLARRVSYYRSHYEINHFDPNEQQVKIMRRSLEPHKVYPIFFEHGAPMSRWSGEMKIDSVGNRTLDRMDFLSSTDMRSIYRASLTGES